MTDILDDQATAPYLRALARRVLIFDGAMGTNIQRRHLTAEDFGGKAYEGCNDHLVLTRPDVIREIHESFLAVGCDVVETCTFQSTPRRLREWGLGDRAHELNVQAARVAREACAAWATPEHPRFVAGSMGPTGMLPSSDDPTLSAIDFQELSDEYYAQAKGLVEGGVDLLLIETSQDILEVKAAIAGIERLFAELGRRVPVQAQVTLDTSGRMLLGTDVASAMTTLEALPVDVIGLNCSTGPEHMREPIRYLAEHAARPVSCIPNAGLPLNTGEGEAVYPLEPEPMATALAEFVRDFGVRVVGGCCGTTPAHLAAVVSAVRGTRDAGRAGQDGDRPRADSGVGPAAASSAAGHAPRAPRTAHRVPRASSAMRAITLHQDPPPLLIGERVNAQGSRRVKQLLLADDYEGVVQVARQQVEAGAHVLDVCVALTERADESEQMARVAKLLSMSVEAPLMIDSTEPEVIARALEHIPGRALVNSINMENGRTRIDAVLPLVKKHGAAVVALTIDEQGMAKTRQRKLEVARRIHDIAVHEYGLAPQDLIFDDLTFTLATGEAEWRDSAVETIEGIRLIKRELPGVLTSLGVSNVSFGLSPEARAVLNSVFLHHCVEAGLDMAIVNPAHIRPYAEISADERALADDLVFDRHPDALQRYIEYFAGNGKRDAGGEGKVEDPTAGMTPDEKIHWHVLHRRKDGIEELLDAAGVREQPVRVLNDVLLPAMKEVGDRFGAGELILPFVLQSAEVMKRAVRHLEQFLERTEGYTKGKVVLATVYGDVHDIGKSLVNTILSNNGYTVFDLGKQVPVNTIIDKAVEVGADAIGLSALLVSTSKQMPICVQELDKRGLAFPVLIGGAAINRRFGRRALFVDGERPYAPGVFYCKDAFEGLDTVEALVDAERRDALVAENLERARSDIFLHAQVGKDTGAGDDAGARSDVAADVPVPEAPFLGTRVLRDIPLREVLALLDLDELFRLQWGGRGSGAAFEAAVRDEFRPVLERLSASAEREGWLAPRAVYGYFPVQAVGNALVVYDPAAYASDGGSLREIARFAFPRQPGRERLCLADYFRPVESGEVDVAAFQVVTVGDEAARRFEALQGRGEYAEAYYLHGLSVEAAEATAEWMHRRIRRELGLPETQGKRYSWGYPACPDLDDHALLFGILPAADALGMELSAAFQLVPEQSTAALVVHHPEAKYYAVRDEAREAGSGKRRGTAAPAGGDRESGVEGGNPLPASRFPLPESAESK
ncbi:MAG TPA: homocysteine S-methyltransferase family protein [Gemmatimonadaceae bacterium]|nr:homocysteine S-methyltransferase family protein [Gemmatimonadaceae bacterium]